MLNLQTPGPGVSEMPNYPSKEGFWYVNTVKALGPISSPLALSLDLAQAKGSRQLTDVAAHGHVPSFVIKQSSPPNAYDPQEAYLYTDPLVPMPPGRYVVTVRATDRSISGPSGDGMYFEWDVPVIIDGPFIKSSGSYLTFIGGNKYSAFDSTLVNSFPWENL